jgi:hypothetical protein
MQEARTRAQSRLSWIAISGLVVNAIFWATTLIHSAADPHRYDGYRYRHGAPAEWAFPLHDVATWIGVMAIEVLVLAFLLRIMRSFLVAACLSLGVMSGMVSFVMLALSMHAPAPLPVQGCSLLFAGGWLVLMAVVSGVAMLVVRDRWAEAQVCAALPRARVVSDGR